jgi:hypothetical protein
MHSRLRKIFSLQYFFLHHTFYIILSTLFFILNSCKPDLKNPEPTAGDADFNKFIAVGGNYLSGYQNGALFEKGQKNSLPALLAKQFQLVGGTAFNQPLMPDEDGLGLNSKKHESKFVQASMLGYKTDCKGETALKPIKDTLAYNQASIYLQSIAGNSFQNLSVPYAKISQLFDVNLSSPYSPVTNPNPFYQRFASNSGASTITNDAVAQQASFFALYTGMEDIYEYARFGGKNQNITSSGLFNLYIDSLIERLTANGAKGVIATIPDLNTLPFFTTVPYNALELTQNKADSLNQLTGFLFNFQEGKNGFVIEYPNGSGNYRKLGPGEFILLTVPLDSVKCDFLGAFTPMPDLYVIDSTEIQIIQNAITAYNTIITQKAQQYSLALVDVNQFFRKVKSGIKYNGADFNSTFVSGGFFSLDGFHPNQKGYAIMADEFIKAINLKYNATIPYTNCDDCDGIIFP